MLELKLCSTPAPHSPGPGGGRGGPSGRQGELWVLRVCTSGHSGGLSLSGSRFVETSALIRLPDDCTVGYIVECKLGGRLQPSPFFHSHLETLQLLGAAQLPEQVSWSQGNGGVVLGGVAISYCWGN